MPFKTKQEKADYDLIYRSKNCEKRKEQVQRWKENNPERHLWLSARARALRNNLEFTISTEDIIIPECCPIFGFPLIMGGDKYNSPSIDRIDATKGYIKGNITIISHKANRIKNNATWQELQAIADWLKEKTVINS